MIIKEPKRYQAIKATSGGVLDEAYDKVRRRKVTISRPCAGVVENAENANDRRETRALLSFRHPNLVSVLALEEDASGPFLVTERICGYTLRETVEAAPFSTSNFVEFVEQALDGLIAAHEAGFFHGNLTSESVLLKWGSNDRFQVKWRDFGFAAPSSRPSFRDASSREARNDLAAFGCLCYFTLTQRTPSDQHEGVPISQLRTDIDPELSKWLMRLITLDPDHRPETARATLRSFRKALARKGDNPDSTEAPQQKPVPTRPVVMPVFVSSPNLSGWHLNRVLGNMVGGAMI